MSGTENALLTIPNSEKKSGSPNHPITSKNLPNLSRAVYYLGGVPPGRPFILIHRKSRTSTLVCDYNHRARIQRRSNAEQLLS